MISMHNDDYFMMQALEMAKIAYNMGEFPVGAVIVKDGQIVSQAYNTREIDKNALSHAEIKAINIACQKLDGWRLFMCDLYVTLEPCPMCAGAIINARIPRIVYGAPNFKSGSCGTVVNLFDYPYNHKAEIVPGICNNECSELLQKFGRKLRS